MARDWTTKCVSEAARPIKFSATSNASPNGRKQSNAGETDGFLEKSFNPVRDELPWPKTADEANELWRKRVKFELLADRLTYAKAGEKPDPKVEESTGKSAATIF